MPFFCFRACFANCLVFSLCTLLNTLPGVWTRLPPAARTFTICGVMSFDPVYQLVQQIPRGRVTTYGALARVLRLRGGARTAGRAMAATPSHKGIPWHRVVGEGGKLLIREPIASLQKKLLESEGVAVLENRVDFKKHQWTPKKSAKNSRKKPARKSARRG